MPVFHKKECFNWTKIIVVQDYLLRLKPNNNSTFEPYSWFYSNLETKCLQHFRTESNLVFEICLKIQIINSVKIIKNLKIHHFNIQLKGWKQKPYTTTRPTLRGLGPTTFTLIWKNSEKEDGDEVMNWTGSLIRFTPAGTASKTEWDWY